MSLLMELDQPIVIVSPVERCFVLNGTCRLHIINGEFHIMHDYSYINTVQNGRLRKE